MGEFTILPGGSLFLLDEDELSQALDEKEIIKDQYDKAYLTANSIIEKFDGKIDYLKDLSNHFYSILKNKLSMK